MDDPNFQEQSAKLKANKKETIEPIAFVAPDLNGIQNKVVSLLSESITSSFIEQLKQDAELSRWIETGLGLVKSKNTGNCLFCEQTLPSNRIDSLEAHYNDAFRQFMEKLESSKHYIDDNLAGISNAKLAFIDHVRFYDHFQESYIQSTQECKQSLGNLEDWLKTCKQALENKRNNPFEAVNFEQNTPVILWTGYDEIEGLIRKHNQETSAFEASINAARKAVEYHYVASKFESYHLHLEQASTAERKITRLGGYNGCISRLNSKISTIERDIKNHRKPAEELNKSLKKYLPHCDIQFIVKDTGYVISRGGFPAKDLSEGEKTTIAFLYFLQSLEDKDFNLKEGIVVIDDPVSSLDSNHMYQTFALMKERLKEAGQLFILTHSFTFYRQVKNWFHNIAKQKPQRDNELRVKFYMIEKTIDNRGKCSDIIPINKLLREQESEYHYLFSFVYKASQSGGEHYSLHAPNAARRLLESFMAFKCPAKIGSLYKQIEDVQDFDFQKKIKIDRLLNTQSHNGYVSDVDDDFAILSEIPNVLTNVMELIEHLDKQHYDAMISLVATPNANNVVSMAS